MTTAMRLITSAWLAFCAVMALLWARRWLRRQIRAQKARDRYRTWLARVEGRSPRREA